MFLNARLAVYEALTVFFLLGEQLVLNVKCTMSILRRQNFYHICVLQDTKLAMFILSNVITARQSWSQSDNTC